MAVLALGLVGAAAGAAAFGTATFLGVTAGGWGWMIGSTIGQLLTRPDGTFTEGPRLSDTKVTISTYGAMIPKLWGTVPVAGIIIDASSKRETAHVETSGGKGGPPESTSITYTYDMDLDIYICEGPIDGIVRVWANENLIYDAGTNNPFQLAEVNKSTPFTLYLGSETQTADPTFEALHGAGNVPGYRGVAHVVFAAFQLSPYGNQVPTFRFEVVKSGTGTYPAITTDITSDDSARAPFVDQAHRYLYWPNEVFKITNRNEQLDSFVVNACLHAGMDEDGNVFACTGGSGGDIRIIKLRDGVVVNTINFPTENADFGIAIASSPAGGNLKAVVSLDSIHYLADFDGNSDFTLRQPVSDPTISAAAFCMSVSPDGNTVLVMSGTNKELWLWDSEGTPTRVTQVGSPTPEYKMGCWEDDTDLVYVWDDGNNRVDVYTSAGAFSATINLTNGATIDRTHMGVDHNGVVWLWRGLYLYTFSNGAINRTLGPFDIEPPSASGTQLMYIAANGLIYAASGIRITPFQYLSPDTVYLTEILQDISNDVDISNSLLTTTDTDTISVDGYVIASYGQAAGAVHQLQKAFFFDTVETGGKIKFVARGGASVVTIEGDDAGAHRDGEERPRGPFEIMHANDVEAPQVVNVAFLDKDNHYQPGLQSDVRISTESTESVAEDFPLVMTNSKALQVAQVNLYTAWQERNRFTVNLPFEYIYLEPGDVIVLSDDVKSFTVRIVRIAIENTLLKLQCVQDDHGGYSAAPVGAEPQAATIDYLILEDAVGLLMDIPLLSPRHDHPGFYFAAANWNSNNPGAELYVEDSTGGQDAIGIASALATVGICRTEANNWPGPGMDHGSALEVEVLGDKTLSSCTYAQIINWSNFAAYGAPGRWEIVQFMTATLDDTLDDSKVYTVSNLMRGRLGTEWAIALHNTGDYFVVLAQGFVTDIRQSEATLGEEGTYRAVTFGKNVLDVPPVNFTNSQMRLKPYSPAQAIASLDWLTGTWTANWNRRTRYYGQWRNLVDVPLNEDTEAYRALWFAGGAITLSSVSRTKEAVFTFASAHGLSVGDWFFIQGTSGSMLEINARVFKVGTVVTTTKVKPLDANTGVILDSRHYTAYTSGGSMLRKVQETQTDSETDTYAAGSPTASTVGFAVCQRSALVGDGVYASGMFSA